MMAEEGRERMSYFEDGLENHDPRIEGPMIYGVNHEHFTLTVYSEDGSVNKYWNVRILKDEIGYCRIACPRDDKILNFNWFEWTAYFFIRSGMKELILLPNKGKRAVMSLSEGVK